MENVIQLEVPISMFPAIQEDSDVCFCFYFIPINTVIGQIAAANILKLAVNFLEVNTKHFFQSFVPTFKKKIPQEIPPNPRRSQR